MIVTVIYNFFGYCVALGNRYWVWCWRSLNVVHFLTNYRSKINGGLICTSCGKFQRKNLSIYSFGSSSNCGSGWSRCRTSPSIMQIIELKSRSNCRNNTNKVSVLLPNINIGLWRKRQGQRRKSYMKFTIGF